MIKKIIKLLLSLVSFDSLRSLRTSGSSALFSRRYFQYICVLIILHSSAFSMMPINLFRPSDKFLVPTYWPCTTLQVTAAYEGAFRIRGYQADDDEIKRFDERRVNPLQIYQCKQDAIAMFKNFEPICTTGQTAQLLALSDDNGDQGIFIPTGDFKIPVNLMFSVRYHFCPPFTFSVHLPFYIMELKNVKWQQLVNPTAADVGLINNFIGAAENLGGLNLGNWKRSGLGDFVLQFSWMQNYVQMKPLLRNVRPQVRLGLSCPTGKKQDEDKILAFPFGADGSWGLQIGGGLDLTFGSYIRGGLDAEFWYFFGNTRNRRIKTDLAQTDLLFLTKVPAFKEFGLLQQFNVYLESYAFVPGFTFKFNYQHLKQNDSKLFVCSDRFDPQIINSAENLQEWTTNSLVFSLNYDPCSAEYNSWFKPYVSLWYKLGLNGKRALVADTVGLAWTLSF